MATVLSEKNQATRSGTAHPSTHMAQDFDDFEAPGINLRDILDILNRRRGLFFQVFVAVLAVGIAAASLGRPGYRATARLVAPVPPFQFNILTDSANPLASLLTNFQGDSIDTQLQVMRSPAFLQDVLKLAGLDRPGSPPCVLSADSAGTDTISVTADGPDPNAIARAANTAIKLHLENTRKRNQAGLDKALQYLVQRQKTARAHLKEAQQKLDVFWRIHRLADIKEQTAARLRRQEDLLSRMQALDARIASTDAELTSLRGQLKSIHPTLPVSKSVPSAAVDRLQKKISELQAQRDELLNEYSPTSQKIRKLEGDIADFQDRLSRQPREDTTFEQEPNPRYQVLTSRIADVEDSLRKDRVERNVVAGQLAAGRRELTEGSDGDRSVDFEATRLTEDRDQARTSEKDVTAKLQDLQIRKASDGSQYGRVLEEAVPPTVPIETNRASHVLTAFIAAILVGVVVVGIQEAIDDRITKPEDIGKLTPLPIMAHVPYIGEDGPPLLTSLPSHSPAGESYRALRFSLRLSMVDGPIRRVLITSPSESEGKSVTAVNLATVMALEGWRVLLIDADLRKPNLHRLLKLSNDTGVSELLAGLSTIEAAVQETPVSNLRVICSGPVPPNPSELLGGEAFRRLHERLSEIADVLIFDSPPCLPVTDPLVMSKEMNGVILVLDAAQTRKAALRHALGYLERAGARVLGLVMNKVSQRSGPYYYYYGRSDYYGQRDDKGKGDGKSGAKRVWMPRRTHTPKE